VELQVEKHIDLEAAVAAVRDAIDFVNRRIINRTDVIDQIFCALLVREHALIQSRTGAAKSLLVMQIFSMFDGADVFKVQASKEQQPDTYFGGLDIEELKKGRIIHNTENSLVESEFGFIDEIFDANDYTLRSLLTILNERALVLGVQNVPAKTHSVIAATNYLRVSEITEAVLDRFMYKSLFIPAKVPYTQYQISRRYIEHKGKPSQPDKKIPYSQLYQLSQIVKGESSAQAISIPSQIIFLANLVIRHYEMQRNRFVKEHPQEHPHMKDFYISPRTQARAMDLLRTSALLHGRNEVNAEDVSKLWYLFTVVGMNEQKELYLKSFDTIHRQYTASRALDQVQQLLDLQDFLETLKRDKDKLKEPIASMEGNPVRRSLMEWAKESLGLTEHSVEQNRRILEGYLKSIAPLTEEIQELKLEQEKDIYELFNSVSHIWT
jgi:MoxR-like ATPase